MSKTEWKEFYRVIEDDSLCDYVKVIDFDLNTYDKAVEAGTHQTENFRIEKYFKQVEAEVVYEYQVLYKNNFENENHLTFGYFASKDEWDSKFLDHNCFIELVQATKRERKK